MWDRRKCIRDNNAFFQYSFMYFLNILNIQKNLWFRVYNGCFFFDQLWVNVCLFSCTHIHVLVFFTKWVQHLSNEMYYISTFLRRLIFQQHWQIECYKNVEINSQCGLNIILRPKFDWFAINLGDSLLFQTNMSKLPKILINNVIVF